MMWNETTLEALKAIGTIIGSGMAAWLAALFTRRSQKESNQINEANALLSGYKNFAEDQKEQLAVKRARITFLEHQVSLWRRRAQQLMDQLHKAGINPDDPDKDLEL